ncbi:MAG TPA: radical SAM protein [Xanthomonadales bacterium]|nr:radical SAM protein [Xanthomonadales bacterium]
MPPRLVVVCRVTTVCNLACGFCAYDRRLPFARTTLADAQIERLIGLMAGWHAGDRHAGDTRAACPTPPAPLLSWLGGEPLLWRDWARFSAKARARALAVSATTNGSTLGSAAVRGQVLQHLDELTVSFDALGARHDRLRGCVGLYARMREAVQALADARARLGSALRLCANVVLMRSTLDDFAELTRDLAAAGIDEISYNLLGGRDRPQFHAFESVLPGAFDGWLQQLPQLRQQLSRIGVSLIGNRDYEVRLQAASRQQPWPVADCTPGEQFLFVDELGRMAPCAFSGSEYGVAIDDVDNLHQLAARFRRSRHAQCASACADCPSTQVFGKFGRDGGVVDLGVEDAHVGIGESV